MNFDELLNQYQALLNDLTAWKEATQQIETAGIHMVFKSNIHQKFAIIDQKIVWYGSINLLSYGSAEESMMRIESNKIVYELMESLEKTAFFHIKSLIF